MTSETIFATIKDNIIAVLPDLDQSRIVPQVSLRDLGANSVDRADIIIQTMEALNVKFPLHEVAGVKNIQGLVDFLRARSAASARA
jgi:polyketide biosynthesis acyl carrier protein